MPFVFRAYESSKLYRDLKLRGALILNKQLRLLPLEQVYDKVKFVTIILREQTTNIYFFYTCWTLLFYSQTGCSFDASLQTSGATMVFDWQFESSKLKPAQTTCNFQSEFARASCQAPVFILLYKMR